MIAILFAVLVGCSVSDAAATDPPLPNTENLVNQFVRRSEQEGKEKLDQGFGFTEHRIHEDFDKNGVVSKRQDQTYQLVNLDGHRFMRLIAQDGRPLSPADEATESERQKKYLADMRKKSSDQGKKDPGDSLKLDSQFLGHFKFNIVGRESLNGRSSYVVTILPAASRFPIRGNMEKVFTHMQGKVWVDSQDYTLAKCDLHLTEPISFYGVLGTIRQLDLVWQRKFVNDKVWLNQSVTFNVEARRLFSAIHSKQESTFGDYQKMAE